MLSASLFTSMNWPCAVRQTYREMGQIWNGGKAIRLNQAGEFTIELRGGALARPVEHDIDGVSEGRSLAQTFKADLCCHSRRDGARVRAPHAKSKYGDSLNAVGSIKGGGACGLSSAALVFCECLWVDCVQVAVYCNTCNCIAEGY